MTSAQTSPDRSALAVWGGTALTALLCFFSFAPVGHPFIAFVALVPALLAVGLAPDFRLWRKASFLTSWALWVALLVWLRHVYPPLGWLGLVLLTAYCALYPFIWLLLARWILPACRTASVPARLLAVTGLAGAWGLGEWVRMTFGTGFGWLPFAASQTGNPVMLSLCSWVGPVGLSMALVLCNLGLARWLTRLVGLVREERALAPLGPMGWLRRLTPELYLGLLPVGAAFLLLLQNHATLRSGQRETITPAVVQTDFDPNAKWDGDRLREHVGIIEELTKAARAQGEPDLIVWPEAALPLTLENPNYLARLTTLAKETDAPLVIGAIDRHGAGYGNGAAVITAEGLRSPVYFKRHLVPFGEYVPFADFLPLRKVVPIEEDCVAGQDVALLPVTSRRGFTFSLGALVCYEDVFPELARAHALAGADALLVLTNDAWYGREAGAHQHAAHSVLLAAATGLPVIRCGNAGWSGTIDPLGRAYPVTDEGGIYFRGGRLAAPVSLPRNRAPATFWVRHGDWAIGLGGLFFGLTYLWRRRRPATATA